MATGVQNTDDLIRRLGGCGLFQCALTTFASLVYMSSAYSMMFMSFGMYNPGWRCLDNATINTTSQAAITTNNNNSLDTSSVSMNYSSGLSEEAKSSPVFNFGFADDTCLEFEKCQRVQFNPKESTIVSEWGLICGESWKASTIASIQLAGMTVGYFISGYLGDSYGRRSAIGVSILSQAISSLLSIASVSWIMFAVLKLVGGICCGILFSLTLVYMAEFVTPKWRAIAPNLPTWVMGCVSLCLLAIAFKDWRYIHIVDGGFTILLLIPLFILPESIRWLMINNKGNKCSKAVKQVAKLNNVDISGDVLKHYAYQQESRKNGISRNFYSYIFLFKKGARRNTFILSFLLCVLNVLYFSSTLGVVLLPGNLYFNNAIIHTCELPANIIAMSAQNIFGRKPTGCGSGVIQGTSLAIFVALKVFASGNVKEIGMLVFSIIFRNCCNLTWYVVVTCTCELYPTRIRSTAAGWMMFMSGVGASVSPYIVLNNDVMNVSYLVLAALSFAGSLMFVFIPETLGKDLVDVMTNKTDAKEDYDAQTEQEVLTYLT